MREGELSGDDTKKAPSNYEEAALDIHDQVDQVKSVPGEAIRRGRHGREAWVELDRESNRSATTLRRKGRQEGCNRSFELWGRELVCTSLLLFTDISWSGEGQELCVVL